MNEKISIIGCGRVGTAIAVYLTKAGYAMGGFASKSAASAEKTAQAAGAGTVYQEIFEAVMAGDIVFITTPDSVIEPVCGALSELCRQDLAGKTFFHCSGALSSAILASAAKWGAMTGSIHPLQSFAPYTFDQTSPFKGINISVEGDEGAVSLGQEMIQSLGANAFSIPTKAKTLYHAAAVVASNYLVTLEDVAVSLLTAADLDAQKAYEILEPLIQGTLHNIKTRGTLDALTGPIARGDLEVVSDHLEGIDSMTPFYSDFYRSMGRYTLALARKKGDLDEEIVAGLKALFAPPSQPKKRGVDSRNSNFK